MVAGIGPVLATHPRYVPKQAHAPCFAADETSGSTSGNESRNMLWIPFFISQWTQEFAEVIRSLQTIQEVLNTSMTGMVLPHIGEQSTITTESDQTNWLFTLTARERDEGKFLIDSGAATSVCKQCLVGIGSKATGPGVELRSANHCRRHSHLHATT